MLLKRLPFARGSICSIIEPNLMIICDCLLTLRTLLGYHFPSLVSGPSDYRRRPSGTYGRSTSRSGLQSWLSRGTPRRKSNHEIAVSATIHIINVDGVEKLNSLDEIERVQITTKVEMQVQEIRASAPV
jgi:hypothetical protein